MNSDVLDPVVVAALCSLDSRDFVLELIELFVDQAALQCHAIEKAIGASASRDTWQAAHALKGGAAQVGARQVADIAATVERLARSGSMDGLAPLAAALPSQIAAAHLALIEALDSYSTGSRDASR